MRGAASIAALCAGLLFAAPALWAQSDSGTGAVQAPGSPVVTLDRDRLFEESRAGQAAQARFDRESAALIAENRKLEAALEAEEQELTARRAQLAPEEFRLLAEAFDKKVEELRAAQDGKSRSLTRSRDEDQQAFFEAAVPVLGRLMVDIGAVAIIDRSAIILTFDQLDITDQAIARLDAEGLTLPVLPAETPESPAENAPQAPSAGAP